jgi:hypothetical protein
MDIALSAIKNLPLKRPLLCRSRGIRIKKKRFPKMALFVVFYCFFHHKMGYANLGKFIACYGIA